MEWVTITAATLDDAKNLALDQLGVAAEDAEFEIHEEPKQGLFGRMRGEARVRARVRPTSARAKAPRREARRERGPRVRRGSLSRGSAVPWRHAARVSPRAAATRSRCRAAPGSPVGDTARPRACSRG